MRLAARAQLARFVPSGDVTGWTLPGRSPRACVHVYKTSQQPLQLRPQQQQQQHFCRASHCMTSWSEDWTSALNRHTNGYDADDLARVGNAATHTPHPALASSSEASEWEAVLSAAEAAAAAPSAAVGAAAAVVPLNGRSSGRRGVYAVIELGSHSTRLLLSDAAGSNSNRDSSITAAAAAQELDVSTAAATMAVLQEYRAVLNKHTVLGLAAVATAAVRHARNAQQLQQSAAEVLGCPVQVLSGEEEGHLAFMGATASLASSSSSSSWCLAFDLGGRSTELAVGTGGTITTLAALQLQLPAYEHARVHMSSLSMADVEGLLQQLILDEGRQRLLQQYPWLTAARAATLVPGCAGLLAAMRHLVVQTLLVSDCDLLDGVMLQLRHSQHGRCLADSSPAV
ncbi:Ppx/GppA phosphatase family-domain-containing protein [Scenedesmus sp. NREL 46B-D3]|nr:Ppx/GppA phosphatase family-domain-containing protein [Scenedesmus sp. NREL 46B-D3]